MNSKLSSLTLLVAVIVSGITTSPHIGFPWEWTPGPNNDENYLQVLLGQLTPEHPDNALIHHIRAFRLMPSQGSDYCTAWAEDIFESGWKDESGFSEKFLGKCQPMFDAIRAGATVEYAHGIDYGMALDIVHFYPIVLTHAANLLGMNARYLEHQGKNPGALSDYLVILKMGSDFACTGTDKLTHLAGVKAQTLALKQVVRLILSRRLPPVAVKQTLRRLLWIEDRQPSYSTFYCASEEASDPWSGKRFEENLLRIEAQTQLWAEHVGASSEEMQTQLSDYRDYLEESRKVQSDLLRFRIRCMKTPWWERDLGEIEAEQSRILDRLPKGPSGRLPIRTYPQDVMTQSFLSDELDHLLMLSYARLAQLAAALELYYLDNSEYPQQLEQLTPRLMRSLPVDPFSGKAFRYKVLGESILYRLWSIGPDGQDDGGVLLYDPRGPGEDSGMSPTRMFDTDAYLETLRRETYDRCVLTRGRNSPGDIFVLQQGWD